FTDPTTSGLYTLSLHDALPISRRATAGRKRAGCSRTTRPCGTGSAVWASCRTRPTGSTTSRCEGLRHGRDGVRRRPPGSSVARRSEEHTSELQSLAYLVCRLLL